MKQGNFKWLLLAIPLFLASSSESFSQVNPKLEKAAIHKLEKWNNPVKEWNLSSKLKPDSVIITGRILNIYFPVSLSYQPFRESNRLLLNESLKKALGKKFRRFEIIVYTDSFTTEQLIPNFFRVNLPVDSSRIPAQRVDNPQLIRKIDDLQPDKGLNNRSIALWHSHGYYFDMPLDRWEWQRAKLFGTVEDISVMGYVLPYLTPMLENAGATVFLPRERDIQVNEVIVDNDKSSGSSEFVIQLNDSADKLSEGFLLADTLFPGINPFKCGTSMRILNDSAVYLPDIPAKGEYAVYISYPRRSNNSRAAKYTVTYSGGKTSFLIDQTIGGETWIYLGTFLFNAGKDVTTGSVTVSATDNGYLALDAIKFGGGMGNVARRPSSGFISNQWSLKENSTQEAQPAGQDENLFRWKISGKPRYLEGARYFLQYAGMPDTLVYSPNNNKNDYNDDYQSRGAWVNYLIGSSDGSTGDPQAQGLGLPIDMAFAFHTDAGVTPDDSIIGTLAIYSTAAGEGKFPDGTSRMASRDLSDIIQTQVVDDISSLFNPEWTRRGLWNKPYSEARRPDVPVMLLELLSHQNMADQKYGLDPRFRFTVSRAVYKGILKYMAFNNNSAYVVQPLPVSHLAITLINGKKIRLSWEPTNDMLESTAKPDKYRVYKRKGENGFDNGIIVNSSSAEIELDSFNTIYSFKVTAINDGGESFDSEILAVGLKENDTNGILVVNGFDRISGPAWFDRDGMAGIAWWKDRGVADHSEILAVGDQYDFDRWSAWLDDDNPGWGASYSDREGTIIPGNTFDYPYLHGKAIMEAGHSFVSVSDEVFYSDDYDVSHYDAIDLIFGEEKSTASIHDKSIFDFQIYNPEFIHKIKDIVTSGKSIFMSGAYIGTDLVMSGDTAALKFAGEYLHFKPRTDHAVKNGNVYSTDFASHVFNDSFAFNTGNDGIIYGAENPDAIEPADKQAVTAFRYSENNTSAGVMYKGNNRTIILGFPFETITSENDRNHLMKQILDFFNNQY